MQKRDDSVMVLNIPIFNRDIQTAASNLIQTCLHSSKTNRKISATGAHGSVFAQKNEEFFEVLNSFTHNLPDGQPMVWVGKMKNASQMQRCYGPDFFEEVMRSSADTPIRHFLCGGREGVAEKLAEACGEKFGNFNICGTYCPPFLPVSEYDYPGIAKQINEAQADVVWIGLSTPKQELFAYHLSKYTETHFINTVGAAFDFHTGSITKAPRLVAKMGMEWFYRLCQEPRRLFSRYAEIVPLFIYYNFRELFVSPKRRRNYTTS
jgi:N-acetylglucosaminyldiphosphoundecaprenol N-acetyl-beta-D-mannosaminyltransferase